MENKISKIELSDSDKNKINEFINYEEKQLSMI